MSSKRFLLRSGALAVLVVVGTLGRPATASLDISFSPTGVGGTPVTVSTFDESPGTALAVGFYQGPNFAPPTVGSTFTLLYQASIGSLLAPDGSIAFAYTSGNGQLTVTASFQETVTSVTGAGANSTVSFAPTGVGTATIYYNATRTFDNLAGTGFTDGTIVYQGSSVVGGSGAFATTGAAPVALDQHGTNDYPTLSTLTGNGSSQVTFNTTTANTDFFKGGIPTNLSLLLSQTTTYNALPFTHVDPSAVMYDGTLAANIASIGAINGLPGHAPNVIFEADAATSFTAVPEPTTMVSALSGALCMIGLVRYSRRNRRA